MYTICHRSWTLISNSNLVLSLCMILSLVDYGNNLLTGCTQDDKSDLQILQNKVLRCCLRIEDPMEINVVEMHDMLEISMVDKRRVLQLLTLIKKNVAMDKIPLVEHERRTRHNDGLKIKLPIPKNEHVRHASYYTGCQLWGIVCPWM